MTRETLACLANSILGQARITVRRLDSADPAIISPNSGTLQQLFLETNPADRSPVRFNTATTTPLPNTRSNKLD
ncbi:hypothetical protein E2C01_064648 [Portunus trituberculatus]|uniref:Uncharacterized protein n=1 Tax=Portunus trituberculatus TaxID=210409 RepID=A0A5B7HKX7_PORTR|nr:hypothetical protein [Portunus trituberculatus]